ncbi:MAG: energy-coupling factor transporter transmembrane component T [Anaerolineae bacterium]|jgi:energy-coupling factor transporter transmembrane protein EcfT
MSNRELQTRRPEATFGLCIALMFLVGAVTAAVVAGGWATGVVLVVVLAVTALTCRSALRPLKRRRYWTLVASLVLLGGLALDQQRDVTLWLGHADHGCRVHLSTAGLCLGLQMAARSTVILTAMGVFTRRASVGDMAALLGRLGASELGFVLGLAVNLLPVVQQTSANTLAAMRLRGGFRRHRLRALRLLLVTILVNVLRYGDDVVCAAQARAFQGARPHEPG